MPFIKSISGFRGTIGGKQGDNFTPIDIVECTIAYGSWLQKEGAEKRVVIGRDARISGEMVSQLVSATLISMGIEVIDLGLSTTPTVEMAVPHWKAGGGVILTASHNPKQWNALKLLNSKGEFISADDGAWIIEATGNNTVKFAGVEDLGSYKKDDTAIHRHIEAILKLPLVDAEAIKKKNYHIVIDCINSTGSISLPPLLDALGCTYTLIHDDLSGNFAHNPEPLPKHLTGLSKKVVEESADLGIAVDPDVDRLVFVNEDGSPFGEEYTLVAVADYVLPQQDGAAVSNLSSSRALKDMAEKHGRQYHAAAVGEVNVVNQMKAKSAAIGGEGNGGIIYPVLHYGRDSLVGIALFLTHLTKSGLRMTELKDSYPKYTIVKDKLPLAGLDYEHVIEVCKDHFSEYPQSTVDGLKIDLPHGWVHLRKSNTEPIVRIYAEAKNASAAQKLADEVKSLL